MNRPATILFTGYAPVHFHCFKPLYERLVSHPGFDVRVSGGLRTLQEDGSHRYDPEGLYGPFGIDPGRILPPAELSSLECDYLFGANTNLIAPGHARCRVQIFHGVSFRNRAIRPQNDGCDFYFLAGPYMSRRFEETGLVGPGDPRALRIGFMKTDALIDGSLSREQLLAAHGFDGRRPVILYAPTGQKHNSLELMGEEVIRRLAATGRYDLMVKLHDHPKKSIDWQERLAPLAGPHVRITRDADVIPLLRLADLLITDASSVSSEFSLRDRPMVFLDVPELIAAARAKASSQVDLESWGRRAGQIARDPGEVPGIVEESLAHPAVHSTIRRAMSRDLFYHPGRATDAAMEWLEGHALAHRDAVRRSSSLAGVSGR